MALPRRRKEEPLLGVTVPEIHRYPLRPEGFEETLFPTAASKRAVAEHLLEAPWLGRTSELGAKSGESAHALEEAVELRRSNGRTEVVRAEGGGRLRWRRKRVLRALGCWREVRSWWDEHSSVDRTVFRVLLGGGSVVEVALERSGDWSLTGVAD
jgi:hypothetical protein